MTYIKDRDMTISAQGLRDLLDSDPTEEIVHQFLKQNDFLFTLTQSECSRAVEGFLSKFPITSDRIPDFTSVGLSLELSQIANRVTFVELKRPSAQLFNKSGRMSQELNDAWIECVESLRLVGANYQDFLRRVVKRISSDRLERFNTYYQMATADIRDSLEKWPPCHMPWFNCVIVIGRRHNLTSEEMLKTQEFSFSTGRSIEVVTYDALLERMTKDDGGRNAHWRFW